MLRWLLPQDKLAEADVDHGMRMLLYDGALAQVMGVLTGGAFLVAFALLLGAPNKVIGLLAAIGPASQVLQIPTIFLVERTRKRKLLTVGGAFASRLFMVLIALIPWFAPPASRLPILIIALFAYFGFGAIAGCSINSWIRDLIPERVMGAYFAKRMAVAIAVGAVLSILGAAGVDFFKARVAQETTVYSGLFGVGVAFGLVSLVFLARVPEPRMADSKSGGLVAVLAGPFKDLHFRNLLFFLGSWNFAVNLAGPFFAVYMLRRLGLSMTWVLGLSVISQLMNVLFLRLWGRLSDRFSNKSVLAASGPLFMLSILLWPFTTMPDKYFLTFPLLIAIHVLAGISIAGVMLCAGNLALKSAPRGTATSYLAVNSLVSGVAATLAPIIAGFAADWFDPQRITVDLSWAHALRGTAFQLKAISVSGLDFLFILSFIVGLYAMHRLSLIKEEGEVEEGVVMTEFYGEVRRGVSHVSNVPGLRQLTGFPYGMLKAMVDKAIPNRRNGGDEPPSEAGADI